MQEVAIECAECGGRDVDRRVSFQEEICFRVNTAERDPHVSREAGDATLKLDLVSSLSRSRLLGYSEGSGDRCRIRGRHTGEKKMMVPSLRSPGPIGQDPPHVGRREEAFFLAGFLAPG